VLYNIDREPARLDIPVLVELRALGIYLFLDNNNNKKQVIILTVPGYHCHRLWGGISFLTTEITQEKD
jgi:hypothetical protein